MAEPWELSVELTNDKVGFTGVSRANSDRPVIFDFPPPLGDGKGYTGLELLLMSFAGCSATTVLYLVRRMGRKISGLKVNARGVRRERPLYGFEKIFLEFVFNSADAVDADVQKALQMAEEAYCPVWQMVKNNVEVATEYRIIAS